MRICQIVRAHGVKGDVKAQSMADDPARFKNVKEAFLESRGQYLPVALSNVRVLSDGVVFHLAGTDTPEAAEILKGAFLCVDRAHAVLLPANTYFVSDLIGCQTYDSDGKSYGIMTDVLPMPGGDVYEIDHGKLLVPALKRVLCQVDTENQRIVFDRDVLVEVGCFAD